MLINPVQLVTQNIYKELNPLVAVTWALVNVGDKVKIETTFRVAIVAISSNDTPIWLNYTDGVIGAGWLYDPDNQFGEFKVGDAIKLWNYVSLTTYDAGDFTIVAKNGNGLIQLDHAVPTVGINYAAYSATVSNKTPITAVKYRYNFIKNNAAPTFISQVDEVSEQLFIAPLKLASDVASTNMQAVGAPEWQAGFASGSNPPQAQTKNFAGATIYPVTIVGVAIDTGAADGIYKSTFKIIHYTIVRPFFLYQMTEPPFVDSNCLKLITKIEAMKIITDPNSLQGLLLDSTLGQSGWYGENYNSGFTPYNLINLTYKVGGISVPSIQLDATETVIEFDVLNTYTGPFTVATQFVIGFHKIPADPAEYKLTGNFLDANFLFDRALQTVGAAAVNGENFAGTYKVLTGISATLGSALLIHVTVKINMAAAVLAGFNASSNPQYFLSFATFNIAPGGSVIQDDAAVLEIDRNTFYTVTSDPTMIVFDNKNAILRHPESDPVTQGVIYPAIVNVLPEDELAANSVFYIESATRLTDVIKLTNTKAQIIVSDGTTTFVLHEFLAQLSAYPFIGYAQQFDFSLADQFHIPIAETLRKYYSAKRRSDLDSGTRYYFSVNYPVLFRWETWTQALGVDSSFFNIALPNNGFNQWWFRYKTGAFKLYYKITVNATKNGIGQTYTQQQEINPSDYASNANFTIKTIKTYDMAGVQLVSGATNYISGFANTEIRAVFKNILAPFVAAGDTYIAGTVVIGIEAWESGGIAGKRRYSGQYVADSDTWFLSLAGDGKVKQSNVGDGLTYHTVTAKVYLDYTLLPPGVDTFKITARIYDNITGAYQEECITQKVYIIPANPVPVTVTPFVPENPLPGCCNDYVIPVLADATGKATQNDVSGFLWWFDSIVTAATMELKQWNGSAWITVVANLQATGSYGTPYLFGFYTNGQGQNFIGYKMNWAAVKALIGTGSYKVTVSYTVPVFGNSTKDSYEYCLQTYSPQLADGTVRLEYWLNGVTGDIEDDTKYKDFGTINWYNSLRVNGYFGYPKSTYKSDDIEYNNGQRLFVEDEQEPVYKLKLQLLPFFLHEIIRTDFMMADELAITDYNSKNNATYIQKYVRKDSGYEPSWYPMQSNLASVELQFKQAFNRFRKLR